MESPGAVPRPDAVLFDLGGVLVGFRGLEEMRAWMPARLDDAEIWRRWLASPAVRRFEQGIGTAEDFAAGVVAEFGLRVAPARFRAMFQDCLAGPLEGAWELLDALRPHAVLGFLSNTSALHWPRLEGEWEVSRRFDHAFPSFRIGAVKPDARAFRHAVEGMRHAPDRILFLDDNVVNVDGARAAGLRAEVAPGVDGARRALRAHGFPV